MTVKRLYISILQVFALCFTMPHFCLAQPMQKLVFCAEGNPETLSPSLGLSANSIDAYIAIYDTLVTYARGETKLTPHLAEYWEISEDGKTYTFHLQQGVKWHSNPFFQPTRHFNADDVLFSIERQWKTDHPYHHVTSSNYSYFKAVGFGSVIKEIKKLDDYTIVFSLNKPNAAFLSMLSLTFTAMQSHEYAMAMLQRGTPEIIDTHPIGTGPFSFVSYEKDQHIRFRTFADHWRGRAKIDALEFLITPNAAERWQRLQKNICQVMPYPNPADLENIRKHPDITILEQAGLNVGYLAYNTTKVPFNDVRVRRALNMAINKQAILDQVFQGMGIRATNLIPPTMWSYNHHLRDDVFDPVAAKQLLKEAGFANGFSTVMWVMPVARAYNPNPQLMGQLIKADLAAIGVQVQIESPDWREYYRRMAQGEHEMGLLGWTTGQGDPDAFFYNLLSCDVARDNGPNVAKFCHKPYEDLVQQARSTANPLLRVPLYEEAQRIFKDQAPWLTIAHAKQIVAVRNNVESFRLSPFARHLFYGVSITTKP